MRRLIYEDDVIKVIRMMPPENGITAMIEQGIKQLPPAQPERKKGKWIPQDYNQRHGNISTTVYYYPKCSVCGCSGDYTDAFCKSCGADMRGE